MKCFYHMEREATHQCNKCGRAVCNDCIFQVDQTTLLCPSCLEQKTNSNIVTCHQNIPNSALTFLFSLVPGAGHMYLGLMNKGFTLLVLFFASIGLTVLFNASILRFFTIFFGLSIPLIWVYSFMDCINSRKLLCKNEHLSDLDITLLQKRFSLPNISFDINIKRFIAIVIILISASSLLDNSIHMLDHYFEFHLYREIREFISEILVPILFIGFGIFILTKNSKTTKKVNE